MGGKNENGCDVISVNFPNTEQGAMKRKDNATVEQKAPLPIGQGDRTTDFADVARTIAGDDAPLWFAQTLEEFEPALMLDRINAAKQPTRAELKKKMQGVQKAAGLIIGALNDGPTREKLDEAPPGPIIFHGNLDAMLRDLDRRLEYGVSSLSTEDGRTRPGRNKAMAAGASHPKTFCAALIAEAWSFIHAADVAPTNPTAAAAADLFWRGCIAYFNSSPAAAALSSAVARELKAWGTPLNVWRHHFKSANGPALISIRQEFRRCLKEGKYRAESCSVPK